MAQLTFKNLLSFGLLCVSCGLASAQENQKNIAAHEVTAAEAKLEFRDISLLEEAFIDATPADKSDGITVGRLGDDGRKIGSIISLAQEIADGKHGNYDSLLIAHKGKLLFESYYLRGRINLPHPQASATKSYTSLVLGRAIQMGYLSMDDLDKPLISFLKELDPTKLVEGAEKITLHKTLTMSSGMRFSDEQRDNMEKNPEAIKGQGQVQTYLELSAPITNESQTYSYGGGQSNLAMHVIEAVVPGTAKAFIKHELLDKIGITDYRWQDAPSGLPEAGWKVSLTSRDMLKLGNLVLNKGIWGGKQLVSADYLSKATSGLVKPTQDWMPDIYRYGYFWYQAPLAVGDKTYNSKSAWGGGGQRVIVVEELGLTIVVTAHHREDTIMALIADSILPVFAE